MHGLLIMFEAAVSIADVADTFGEHGVALRRQRGFVSMNWLMTDKGFGGFYLFTDQSSAEAYLDTPLAAGLMGTPAFRHFEVRHFDVLPELGAVSRPGQVSRQR